jgi:hypothetical protein
MNGVVVSFSTNSFSTSFLCGPLLLMGILYCDLFIPSGSLVEGGVTFLNVSIAAFCMIIGNESPEGLLGMGDSILDAQIDIGIQSWSI